MNKTRWSRAFSALVASVSIFSGSALLGCGDGSGGDAGVDSGGVDSGSGGTDAGRHDAGADAGGVDASAPDAGGADAGAADAGGATDAGADGGAPCPAGAICEGTYNLAFVTSTTSVLSTIGLSGADAECNARAADAGLPGTYVAWLSSSTSDAATRLGSASGWLRVDRRPFAASAADLLAGRLLYPLYLDENGDPYPEESAISTGTNPDGTVTTQNCSDWASTLATDRVTAGYPQAPNTRWTVSGLGQCNLPSNIYCLGTDHVSPITVAPASGRFAFVSQGGFDRSAGLAAADDLCQTEATAASLPGTYKALLATTSASAISRFSTSGATWVRVDGLPIWESAADAGASAQPLTAFMLEADGTPSTAGRAWIGATTLDTVGTDTCADWSSDASTDLANVGAIWNAGRDWISTSALACDRTDPRVICLQE